MNTHDLIVRTYQDAAFIMNRRDWSSIFFEGTLANKVLEIIENKKHIPPKNPTQRNDFLLLTKSVKEFLKENCDLIHDTLKIKPKVDYSILNLCKYARREWQVINTSLELLSLCNQRCLHCYWEKLNKKGLSLKNLLLLAKDLKEVGVIFVLLTGGEIFLRPDITEIFSFLDELKFAIEVKTNGLLLNQRIIDFLSKVRIYDLQVSIYEIKDGYSFFTNSNYNFSRIAENINLLLSAGIKTSLSVIVGNHNIDEIQLWHEKLQFFFGENIDVSYNPLITPNRDGLGKEAKLRLSKTDLDGKFFSFLEKIDGFPVINKYRDCSTENTICYAGRDQIVIDPDGNVYPCLSRFR